VRNALLHAWPPIIDMLDILLGAREEGRSLTMHVLNTTPWCHPTLTSRNLGCHGVCSAPYTCSRLCCLPAQSCGRTTMHNKTHIALVCGAVTSTIGLYLFLARSRFDACVPAALSSGKVWLVDWPMCSIYMMNDAQYPAWIMLVPRKVGFLT
jgi:hypothetical protein